MYAGRNMYTRGNPAADNCVLGLALVPCEGQSTSPRRIRATPAQKSERRVGTAGAEHSLELAVAVHGDSAELRVPASAGIRAQAKDRSVLAREHAGERGAVREVLVEDLVQFRVPEARWLAAD